MLAAACGAAGLPLRAATVARAEAVELPPLDLIDGSRIDAADWKGRAAVLVFWSTDCAFCRRHNARLDRLHRGLRERGSPLRIVGIATDRDLQAVRRHVREHDLGFPIALDGAGIRKRFTERSVVPLTVLIDRTGHLLLTIPGEMSDEDVAAIGRQLG